MFVSANVVIRVFADILDEVCFCHLLLTVFLFIIYFCIFFFFPKVAPYFTAQLCQTRTGFWCFWGEKYIQQYNIYKHVCSANTAEKIGNNSPCQRGNIFFPRKDCLCCVGEVWTPRAPLWALLQVIITAWCHDRGCCILAPCWYELTATATAMAVFAGVIELHTACVQQRTTSIVRGCSPAVCHWQ